jgi:hypothetical protein
MPFSVFFEKKTVVSDFLHFLSFLSFFFKSSKVRILIHGLLEPTVGEIDAGAIYVSGNNLKSTNQHNHEECDNNNISFDRRESEVKPNGCKKRYFIHFRFPQRFRKEIQ